MAIIDRQNLFSDNQVLASGTTASTDILDLQPLFSNTAFGSNTARDLGVGEDIYLQVNVTGVAGTSPTLTVALQTDDTSGFSTPVTLYTSAAIPLPAAGGQVLIACLPYGDYEKFLRLNYTVGGTGSPAATVKAALVRGVTAQKIYTDAVAIR
jgi:hypothetical protein